MPLGGKNEILQDLKIKSLFSKFLSKAKINSKFTPKLIFYLDDTFDKAKIEKLFKKDVVRDIN